MTPRASDKRDKFSPRGVAAGADAEINLFRRGSRASRFFRAAGPHSRKNLDVARARRARAFEFERSVVSVGAAFPSSDARARVGRRPSSRASRDARARRTATRARVPRRRRRRRRRPTRSSRVVVVARASSSSSSSRAASCIVRSRSNAVDGAVFNLHFTRQRGNGLFLFRMSIHIHMSNVFKCPYVYYLRLSHDSSESS